jgi:hypothetical protein
LQLAFALCRLDCIFPAALWRHLLATEPNSFLQSLAMRPLVTRTKLAKKTQGVAGSAGFLERQSGLLAAAAKLCRFLLSGPQHATFLGCSNLVWPLVIKWCGIFGGLTGLHLTASQWQKIGRSRAHSCLRSSSTESFWAENNSCFSLVEVLTAVGALDALRSMNCQLDGGSQLCLERFLLSTKHALSGHLDAACWERQKGFSCCHALGPLRWRS